MRTSERNYLILNDIEIINRKYNLVNINVPFHKLVQSHLVNLFQHFKVRRKLILLIIYLKIEQSK